MNMLIRYGCDRAQGYFFGRPCAAEELTAWLADSPFGVHAEAGD
jgi:EAL domain-containing protein (putative c-di-GMP-specific phosphodiesterase class I)